MQLGVVRLAWVGSRCSLCKHALLPFVDALCFLRWPYTHAWRCKHALTAASALLHRVWTWASQRRAHFLPVD